MIKIFKRLKLKDWLHLLLILGFVIAQVYLDLKMPDYTKELTSKMATISTHDVWYNGGMMMLCALGSMAMSMGASYVSTRLAANFSRALRKDLYSNIMSLSNTEMKKFQVSSLVTRMTNDVVQVQMFIGFGFHVLLKAPVTAIWAICKISATSIEWTSATLITVAVLVLSVGLIVVFAVPKFRKIQKLTDNLNNVTRENITGVRVVRAFNAEEYQAKKFEIANDETTRNQTFTSKIMGALMPIMTLALSGLTLAIYWIGAILINNAPIMKKGIVLGDMMAFSQYAIQIVMSFVLLIAIFVLLPRAIVSSKRINEVMDTKSSILDGNKTNSEIKGSIEFKDVSFVYPDGKNNVISNISFKVNKGETLAIIGSTGCGKTTIIDLITRFYDSTKGSILIDNINVKDYKLSTLNDKISLVTQKACLFKGDIKYNVAYGDKNIDIDKVNRALTLSESNFVSKLEKGINSEVAQGGTNYSGGQKQRLSIARAIYKESEIIIFDDSFSALDYQTDMKVRKNIKDNLKDRTVVIVAQRIGTIRNADKILVVDKGRIVGNGRHEELIKSCSVYKEIALSQLSKEEL